MTLTKPLQRMHKGISITNKESSVLIYATCVCCAMEALGKFINNSKDGKSGNFKAFAAYMHSDLQNKKLNGRTYSDILWKDFRNGLAHGLAICHGGFEYQPEYFVIKKMSGNECLYIDPKRFHNDFRSALGKLLKDIKKAQPTSDIHVNFTKVFNDVFVKGK